MKKHGVTKIITRMIALALVMVITVSCGAVKTKDTPAVPTGGGRKADPSELEKIVISATDLMAGIDASGNTAAEPDTAIYEKAIDFAMKLFGQSYDEKNPLISALSVIAALGMTANGAAKGTLTAMENTLGMTADEASIYIAKLMETLKSDSTLSLANSIWFKDDPSFHVNESFLKKNADFFKASLYKAPFDSSTLADINGWVCKNTKGMIPEILTKIPDEAIMYLVNALAFEAKWENAYEDNDVRKDTFTKEDGTKTETDFMFSEESTYLHCAKATGFIKRYEGRKYAFVALLPNEGVSVKELVESLDGQTYRDLMYGRTGGKVYVSIPKFETSYSVEMKQILESLGMGVAFDPDNADFSGLGTYDKSNICIGSVIHKTFISVDEQGTKAAAATAVGMVNATSVGPERFYTVYLDRPFVYMLVDLETSMPLFTGVMNDVSAK